MVDACCSCETIREIVKEEVKKLFDDEIIKLKTTSKKKRAPSKYNIFIGKCMKEDGKNMKVCAAEYRKEKGASPGSKQKSFGAKQEESNA